MIDYARTKRIPQEGDGETDRLCKLLNEAASIARTTLESIQTLAGTTVCKVVQIAALEKWAKEKGCWIDDISLIGVYSSRGSENEVYSDLDNGIVYKLNDFRYADDNLTPFFERLEAHNHYFEYCKYELIGMAKNQDGKVCAVLKQAFIEAEREATEQEIHDELERMGFLCQYEGECYSNGEHDIYDALPNNVLVGMDGLLYFIDTIIYRTSPDTFTTYKNQSPRYSS